MHKKTIEVNYLGSKNSILEAFKIEKSLNIKSIIQWLMVQFDNILITFIIIISGYFIYVKRSFKTTTYFEFFLLFTLIVAIVIVTLFVFVRDMVNKKEKEHITKYMPFAFVSIWVYTFLLLVFVISIMSFYYLISSYILNLRPDQLAVVSGVFTFLTYFFLNHFLNLRQRYDKFLENIRKKFP